MTLTELNEIKQNYKVLELAIDFINPSYNISRAKHLDTARYIVCTLTENGVPRTVKANESARIRLQKPDRTYVYNDCDILEDGRVFITLTEQILATEGNAICDIQLTNEKTGIIYSTKNFIINIDKTAVNNSVMESTSEFGALNNLIATNKKLNNELKENEDVRQANEIARIENETNRQGAEAERVNAENARIINENQRIANENTRQANETIRQTQETDRETNTSNAIFNAEKAAQKANNAADDLENKLNSHHFILSEDKGIANGVAELDSNGLIPSNQLPSYVDDVIEGYLHSNKFYKEAEHITEITGESGKIYVDLTTNKTYRWSGSAFAIISETIALGETSSTAYRGDRGKIAYDHSQAVHAPADAEANQNAFSNVTVGSTAISADSKTDTLTLEAGDNITLIPDVENSKITISSTCSGDNGNYLPLSGGTLTGRLLINHLESTSWIGGRKKASIYIYKSFNSTDNGYWPILSTKTPNGTWDIGIHQYSNGLLSGSRLSFSLISDSNVESVNNATTTQFVMQGNGKFYAPNFVGALTGNADSATVLATPRNITIGNLTKSFNGSADIAFNSGFTGATAAAEGIAGLVPAPSKKANASSHRLLRDDGVWAGLYSSYTDNSIAHPASTAGLKNLYDTLNTSIIKKIGLGSSGTIAGSKTLSVVPGDIVIITGYGSGGTTYIFSIYDSTHFMINGATNGSNIYSSFTPSASLGTLASMYNNTLTLTKLTPWSACYYIHLHIG